MNAHARGSEPRCSVQGPRCLGIVRTKGATRCHACSRMKTYKPPPEPKPPAPQETSRFADNGDSAELFPGLLGWCVSIHAAESH